MFTKDRLRDPALLRFQAFIAGEWRDSDAGGTLAVTDPATGETLGTVPDCGASETRAAIAAAEAAFPAWRRTPPAERAAILERWNALILENAEDLAAIMTAEQGKPLAEARGEVAYGASFAKWFAEEARRITGDVFTAPAGDRRVLVLKEPVGVCAAITPWNFPIAMITRKVAPAFAAGCPIVVKPADLTPFSALALAVLAERAGVPKGVFSVVTGQAAPIGAEMTGSETVRKLSFTGSTAVGRLLMAQSAPTIKRLSLELGGNAPFIVFDDADLDQAVAGIMASKFRNAGQTCVCANRILVQDGIHDRLAARLGEEAAKLRVGNGFEAGVTIGPLINDAAAAKVTAHLDDALARGARLVAGDRDALNGRFVPPLVLTGAETGMRLASEETFGPLAPLMRFSREEDAIAIANATPFGLASYFYTADIRRAWRVGEALDFGMVGLNTGTVSMEAAPFGGVKQSGLGREGSTYGIDEYLELKSFHMGGL
ncbi:succinate-semialdehyde dehydrogenase / glutarate-semialdehyde dehydrogenase [Methylobacterium sp. 174MFSha1.1]|uniref:NAD-dependent succinate-semialdehyde dehydrogenase n=1 Tax=Methylobacterium sp. 174MFSha1.1 TaxID=1502749 RepID=UPI0008E7C877|nr:NAD-dependent succinate-semialdehyde dehydrogenase [Methylobacterium sp. 174MFSha1.1]SFV16931.1 succinate-semialdehyde dehydrogenase / glutarate-semialdehyde dehydrogenase [Methylobacterium sp. 174MFSha1.1]